MCDKELLLSYLYDELGDAERARIEAHLRTCAGCRDELAGLRGIRADLSTWAPPEPEFGFRIVREPRSAPRTWRARVTPALGLAAAAALVLAAASAVANVEVRYGSDGLTIRTGWHRATVAAPPQGAAARDARLSSSPQIDPAALQVFERRIAELEQQTRSLSDRRTAEPSRPVAANARMSDAEVLKRVHDLLAQSESRQQTSLALQMQRLTRDFDMKRATDLARVQQGLNYIDGRATAEAAAHRELANIVYRVAQQK